MRILFTSASRPPALALARVLAAEGHVIYAVDEESVWGTAPARYSRAYTRFYPLRGSDDIAKVWEMVADEIDLIVSFGSDLDRAGKLKEKGANVIGYQLFETDHEFQDFVREVVLNTPHRSTSVVKVPASFAVHSRTCIAEILGYYPSTTFSLQAAPYDDPDDEDTLVNGFDSSILSIDSRSAVAEETPLLLCCSTLDDKKVEAIKDLPISDTTPYRLIEVVEGGTRYAVHVFVNGSAIRTFAVTAPPEDQRMRGEDFVIVPSTELLFDALLQFTKQFIEALNTRRSDWTQVDPCAKARDTPLAAHMSLTFNVKEEIRNGDLVRRITALGCSNDPHASLILFCALPSLRHRLALAYTQLLATRDDAYPLTIPDISSSRGLYSITSMASGTLPLLRSLSPWKRDWWPRLAYFLAMCGLWLVCFQEEMWNIKDPGPALCLWAGALLRAFGWFWWEAIFQRALRKLWKNKND